MAYTEHLAVQDSLSLLREHIERKIGYGTSTREVEDLLRYTGNGSRRMNSESLLSEKQRRGIRQGHVQLANATSLHTRFG